MVIIPETNTMGEVQGCIHEGVEVLRGTRRHMGYSYGYRFDEAAL